MQGRLFENTPACQYLCKRLDLAKKMKMKGLLLACLFPALGFSQPAAEQHPAPMPFDAVQMLADSLASVDELHGPYVGFSGTINEQYKNFGKLVETADPEDLLELMAHSNAVVRGYAFWGLAREQYEKLDSVLLAHARDEAPVRVRQGGVVASLPLVDFLQWVVNPDMLDRDCKKLDESVIDRVAVLRFSDR